MPRCIVSDEALFNLNRLRQFLAKKDRSAAQRMRRMIFQAFDRLALSPLIGASCGDYRRIVVKFGGSSYLVYYEYDKSRDLVTVLWLQHSREDLDHPDHGKDL